MKKPDYEVEAISSNCKKSPTPAAAAASGRFCGVGGLPASPQLHGLRAPDHGALQVVEKNTRG